jgi:hypothetical protein
MSTFSRASDEAGPILWIDQAFTVAAAITLCLDAMHKSPEDAEYAEDREHVDQAINYLNQFPNNKIATRGIKLLAFLQKEIDAKVSKTTRSGTARVRVSNANSPAETMPPPPLRQHQQNAVGQPMTPDSQANMGPTGPGAFYGADSNFAWQNFTEMLPPQTGFGGLQVFNDFFANYPFDFQTPPTSNG